jgi:RIO kinase 1
MVAMARKRDTEHFQRMHQSVKDTSWDDDESDPEASTYTFADARGPEPVPPWVITADAARQFELGMLKTGKEADVHLVERRHGDEVNILAAKRYRKFEDRLFRNDARYRTGRRTGESRLDKAIAQGNRAGMAFRARQWLETEFAALCTLWAAGVSVPYPVQQFGAELMIELIGSPEQAAPRLVHAQLDAAGTRRAWDQVLETMRLMLRAGIVHGDLSPYNILWDRDHIVVIDFPQAVDPVAHPEGMNLLERDVTNVCGWFARRGITCDPSNVFADLLGEVT